MKGFQRSENQKRWRSE